MAATGEHMQVFDGMRMTDGAEEFSLENDAMAQEEDAGSPGQMAVGRISGSGSGVGMTGSHETTYAGGPRARPRAGEQRAKRSPKQAAAGRDHFRSGLIPWQQTHSRQFDLTALSYSQRKQ